MPFVALPGITELIIIFGVVLLLFGGKKLPQLGGAIGESIKNFRKGVKDDGTKELDAKAAAEAAAAAKKNEPIVPQ